MDILCKQKLGQGSLLFYQTGPDSISEHGSRRAVIRKWLSGERACSLQAQVEFADRGVRCFAASKQLLVARILDQARQPQGGEAGKGLEQGWRIGRN
ncbi:hypothetical protein SNOG_07115 [Parastagonospora nodorum SN15]|uniref:Uncharacterized protein n=1 Tax=Phaeosphaeria nodorum (strain SN15 / ATCC MYA-4574 / FGSC 10173) TaxID=321614 RepID=Q0UM99_PHANO|nr:hypothetical protein SNOG_07115 [Parastagonospora nodorum SN15]EAT85766.1 hypothetical protein SNOG_07115 [Parastagonospora nodorum SN15]